MRAAGNPNFPFDTARLRHVIELVAERSGWAKKNPGNGRALGIAAHYSFLSTWPRSSKSKRTRMAPFGFPASTSLSMTDHDRDRVRAQFEGAAVFGTSLALMEK